MDEIYRMISGRGEYQAAQIMNELTLLANSNPDHPPPAISPELSSILSNLANFEGDVAMSNAQSAVSFEDLPAIKLKYEDIHNKAYDPSCFFLYDGMPIQCHSCGFRFSDTEDGRLRNTIHLDWHFRRNRKMKERAKKAPFRSWFLNEKVIRDLISHLVMD
jgi:hypothetical protein